MVGAEGYIVYRVLSAPAPQALSTSMSLETQIAQLHRTTSAGRKELQKYAMDIVSAGELVQQAGRDAGVTLHIAGAVTPLTPTRDPARPDTAIDSTVIVIDAQGNLSRLVHLISLLETLPMPSMLQQFQLSRVGQDKKVTWRLSAQLKIFYLPETTAL